MLLILNLAVLVCFSNAKTVHDKLDGARATKEITEAIPIQGFQSEEEPAADKLNLDPAIVNALENDKIEDVISMLKKSSASSKTEESQVRPETESHENKDLQVAEFMAQRESADPENLTISSAFDRDGEESVTAVKQFDHSWDRMPHSYRLLQETTNKDVERFVCFSD